MTVSAFNAAGVGKASSALPIEPNNAIRPTAPREPEVLGMTADCSAASVGLDADVGRDTAVGCSGAESLTLHYRRASGDHKWESLDPVAADVDTIIMDGLDPADTYELRVVAANGAGQSRASPTVRSVVLGYRDLSSLLLRMPLQAKATDSGIRVDWDARLLDDELRRNGCYDVKKLTSERAWIVAHRLRNDQNTSKWISATSKAQSHVLPLSACSPDCVVKVTLDVPGLDAWSSEVHTRAQALPSEVRTQPLQQHAKAAAAANGEPPTQTQYSSRRRASSTPLVILIVMVLLLCSVVFARQNGLFSRWYAVTAPIRTGAHYSAISSRADQAEGDEEHEDELVLTAEAELCESSSDVLGFRDINHVAEPAPPHALDGERERDHSAVEYAF